MKIWTKLLTLVMVLGIAVLAGAKEKKKGEKAIRGTIVSVDTNSIKVDTGTKKVPGETKTFNIKDAVISVNGELKTASALHGGMKVSIKASGDNATAVTAMSGKGGKKKKAA